MLFRNSFYYLVGLLFLILAKAKNALQGYTSPKPFPVSAINDCVSYDLRVVDSWLDNLESYCGRPNYILTKSALELGPGSDLGIGVYLLAKGCEEYLACDVNDLAKAAPMELYDELFRRLSEQMPSIDIQNLQEQLGHARSGLESRLDYKVRQNFNLIEAFGENRVDIVFSQAAFEHFDNIKTTIDQLTRVCKTGAKLVVEIDFKTHSRWVRDKDPNSIYRYNDMIYRLFWFRGIPNRRRPYEYVEALEKAGWTDITVQPLQQIAEEKVAYTGLSRQFSEQKNQMEILTAIICARRPNN